MYLEDVLDLPFNHRNSRWPRQDIWELPIPPATSAGAGKVPQWGDEFRP